MKISEEIQNLIPYSPGKPIDETKRELGLNRVYKLASNENPLGPSSKVLEAIGAELTELHRYPDAGFYELRQAHTKKFGFAPEWFTFGNGSNEIIDLLIRVFCAPGESVLTSANAFVAYGICTKAARANFLETPMAEDMKFDLKAMKQIYDDAKSNQPVRLIFIANPNNPTGTYVGKAELDEFLDSMRGETETLIILDEAYLEFVDADDYPDSLQYVKDFKNVMVTRTMSKVHGLAGLRVGSLIGHPEFIDLIDRVRNPFNVNNLAQRAAIVALDDEEYLKRVREVNTSGRDYFYAEFEKLGIKFWKSQANFVLIEPQSDGRALFNSLLKLGVIVRPVPLRKDKTFLRISIGTKEENEACVAALTELRDAL